MTDAGSTTQARGEKNQELPRLVLRDLEPEADGRKIRVSIFLPKSRFMARAGGEGPGFLVRMVRMSRCAPAVSHHGCARNADQSINPITGNANSKARASSGVPAALKIS